MAYSTITDLTRWIDVQEIVRLCTTEADATIESESVTSVAEEAIESADALIDSYLLGRWPQLRGYDPVPDEINRISATLAVYNLYLRRRAVSGDWRCAYEDCKEKLEAALRGEHSLGLDDAGSVAGCTERSYRTDAEEEDRVYTEDRLKKL